jgi:hypothetical protein
VRSLYEEVLTEPTRLGVTDFVQKALSTGEIASASLSEWVSLVGIEPHGDVVHLKIA